MPASAGSYALRQLGRQLAPLRTRAMSSSTLLAARAAGAATRQNRQQGLHFSSPLRARPTPMSSSRLFSTSTIHALPHTAETASYRLNQ